VDGKPDLVEILSMHLRTGDCVEFLSLCCFSSGSNGVTRIIQGATSATAPSFRCVSSSFLWREGGGGGLIHCCVILVRGSTER
jgi:hypothetical protein